MKCVVKVTGCRVQFFEPYRKENNRCKFSLILRSKMILNKNSNKEFHLFIIGWVGMSEANGDRVLLVEI